ncbi:F-box only protein 43-like [Centruroides vittatus]|uniref:F-box only protein 43-like n=1 Tax=Centruroides vittatus TaxID=120091 RepID=UPI00350FED9C
MYLTPFELCKVSWVSRTWKNVCLNDANAKSIIENYLYLRKYIKETEKENLNLLKTPTFDKLSRRIPFVNVQNTISKEDIPGIQEKKTAPWPKSRYQLFREEANKCNPGERLQICPRCGSPSRVISIEQRGKCSDLYCAFDFCIVCLNEFHKQNLCKTKVKPINKSHSIGSKQSKRKLKRL